MLHVMFTFRCFSVLYSSIFIHSLTSKAKWYNTFVLFLLNPECEAILSFCFYISHSKAYKEQLKRDSVVTAKAIINNDNVKERYEKYMKVNMC